MAESLRNQLAANLDKIETKAAPETAPIDDIDAKTIAESEAVGQVNNEKAVAEDQTRSDKPGRTAGRERDEKGRLLPGPAKRDSAAASEKADNTPTQGPAPAPAAESKPRPNYPTTFRKGHEQLWNTLPHEFLDELVKRERDYANGVSTYKTEWENAKPLIEATSKYRDVIQATGRQPAQWIDELGTAHRYLTQGTPEEKVATLMAIAVNNGIDLGKFAERVFVRGQDGQIFVNPQLAAARQQPMPQAQQQPQQNVEQVVMNVLAQKEVSTSIEAMRADSSKYPHFEQVRETMAGLLQSGLADDLPSAYQAALALPKHRALYEADQKQVREQDEARKREEARATAQRARANSVSPRSQTPTGQGTAPQGKGLRATLEANADEILASRV